MANILEETGYYAHKQEVIQSLLQRGPQLTSTTKMMMHSQKKAGGHCVF